MLSEQERGEIDAARHAGEPARAVAPDALKIVQRHRRWVSDEALADVAQHLGLSPHELDGIATFYTMIFRQPVGRHVILVCDSVSCWVCGSDGLLAQLKARLGIGPGETTADGAFTLLPTACLGVCHRAPALMIDEDLHTDLTPEALDELLARYAAADGKGAAR